MEIEKHHFESIDSTNSYAKREIDSFNPFALTLITASEQTAGRGRFKRTWVSPKGLNLYATFVFFLKMLRDDLGNIPQVLALSAIKTLHPHLDQLKVKWPNDLVVGKDKLGGILCEVTQSKWGWGVIAGIGVNINMPEEKLKEIDRPATSLLKESGREFQIETLSSELAVQFLGSITLFLLQGFDPFLEDFKKELIHKKNDRLHFNDFQHVVEGSFAGINRDGSLNLLMENGIIRHCATGELL